MLSNFRIDQAATFAGLVYLSSEPKLEMGSNVQATTKDGTKKWEVQVLGAFKGNFGKSSNEVVKIGMAGQTDPCAGLNPFTPVELRDFEVGVMEKTKKDQNGNERVIGVTVWFRCSEVLNVAEQRVSPAKAA
jgi:hypothetical protein